MLGFCVPVPSLSGRSASLRVLPERAAGRFLKHLIWRILLVIRRPVSGVESIFLPGLREGRSKPAGLVERLAAREIDQRVFRAYAAGPDGVDPRAQFLGPEIGSPRQVRPEAAFAIRSVGRVQRRAVPGAVDWFDSAKASAHRRKRRQLPG